MKRPALIASALLLVVATAAPAMADHIDRLPFGKTEVVGAGWASFMIHTGGSVVGVPLSLKAPGSMNELPRSRSSASRRTARPRRPAKTSACTPASSAAATETSPAQGAEVQAATCSIFRVPAREL